MVSLVVVLAYYKLSLPLYKLTTMVGAMMKLMVNRPAMRKCMILCGMMATVIC